MAQTSEFSFIFAAMGMGAGLIKESILSLIGIVGMNSLGRRLAMDLTKRGDRVLAVDSDPRKLEGLPCPTLLGNAEHLSVL